MCGIAGFFLPRKPAELSDVHRMCDAMRHRGPDDQGFHLDGGCALGMRRLSIIDLNTGHQPISNEDENIWIDISEFVEKRVSGGAKYVSQFGPGWSKYKAHLSEVEVKQKKNSVRATR